MSTYAEMYSQIINDNQIKPYLEKSSLSVDEQEELLYTIIASVAHYRRKQTYMYDDLPHDFCVIDLETTGLRRDDPIIQCSAIKYRNSKQVDQFNTYVNTNNLTIPQNITNLTGITNDMLANAPAFTEISEDFITFVGNDAIVGQNISSFDLPKLRAYGIDFSTNKIYDTRNMAKAFNLGTEDNKLETLKEFYGIDNVSHNALADCDTTGQIYIKFLNKDFVPVQSTTKKISLFDNKKIAISGTFSKMSRKAITSLVQISGGKVMNTVGKTTDIFLDGIQTSSHLVDGKHSQKELDAKDKFEATGKPIILHEDDLYSLLSESD